MHFYGQWANNILNDTYYYQDICLFTPPHLIALAIVYVVGNLKFIGNSKNELRLKEWFSNLNVNMNEIGEITNKILDIYKFKEKYSLIDIENELINKLNL